MMRNFHHESAKAGNHEREHVDRIYWIYQVFSQFPDETEKGGAERQNTIPVNPVSYQTDETKA